MRGTLHLVSRKDYVRFRRTLQPMLTAGLRSILRDRIQDPDVAGAVDDARRWFDEEPRTFDALRTHLEQRFPGSDVRALAYAVRMELPLLQVPATGERWAYPARAAFAVAESWLGELLRQAMPSSRSSYGILRRSVPPRPPTRRRGAA